ncbi:MAG: DUF4232 domain-containing protein [Chloroflexi bacterium]|nr:DUF4232 domain-containing protein [Chloroflexota bacterium]
MILVTAVDAFAQPVSPPVQLPQAPPPPVAAPPPATATPCTALQLSASFVSSEGAAGTILDTLQLTNTSSVTCTVQGFVTLHMIDAGGINVTTRDVPGGGILNRPPDPDPIALAPGQSSPFGVAWSDVPVGNETTCPAAAMLAVTPPGGFTELSVPVDLAPCGGGTVNVGALRAPGESVL